jgi:predicted component of type VI protein secretion system
LAALSDLVRLYAGQQFDVTVRPVLAAGEVPALRLARMEHNGVGSPQGSRLGWTTWLISHPPLDDATDAEFKVDP